MAHRRRGNFNYLEHYTYFVPNVREIVILFVWLVVGTLAGSAVSYAVNTALGTGSSTEMTELIAYPIMFIPPMIYAASRSRRNSLRKGGVKVDSGNFSPVGGAVCSLLVVVGTVTLSYCAEAVGMLLPEMPEGLKNILESMTSGTLWVNFLCVSIFAPVFEEWLCRGMVLRGLLGNGVKPVWAIVTSAFIFALIHMNPWQAVPAFMLGCLFGYVYYRTGSLKLTMLMHFANNTLALVMSQIPSLEDVETWRDVFDGPEYFVIMGCCVIVVALVVIAFNRIPLREKSGNFDKVSPLFGE